MCSEKDGSVCTDFPESFPQDAFSTCILTSRWLVEQEDARVTYNFMLGPNAKGTSVEVIT